MRLQVTVSTPLSYPCADKSSAPTPPAACQTSLRPTRPFQAASVPCVSCPSTLWHLVYALMQAGGVQQVDEVSCGLHTMLNIEFFVADRPARLHCVDVKGSLQLMAASDVPRLVRLEFLTARWYHPLNARALRYATVLHVLRGILSAARLATGAQAARVANVAAALVTKVLQALCHDTNMCVAAFR